MAFDAACYCGELKLSAKSIPDDVTRCNCSLCFRLGALWAYYSEADVEISTTMGVTERYVWGEQTMVYHRCVSCGCTTHYSTTESNGNKVIALNCRMADPQAIEPIPVRDFDGARSWRYFDE